MPETANEVKNKIVFFHGINRAKDKGSGYIQKAMSKLQERYPNPRLFGIIILFPLQSILTMRQHIALLYLYSYDIFLYEVIVCANAYIACIMGITMNGATPVFVEPDEYDNINALGRN